MNNPLFESDVGLVYDNPLFYVDVDHTPDTSSYLGDNCSILDLSNESGFQTRLMEEFHNVYMVRSAYNFSFDPLVHD